MPTYEYLCEACGHELELFQNITEGPKKRCPACKKQKLKRKIGGGAGFLFKGSGFYLTDYRSDSYKKAADADKKAPESGAGATSEKSEKTDKSEKPEKKPAASADKAPEKKPKKSSR